MRLDQSGLDIARQEHVVEFEEAAQRQKPNARPGGGVRGQPIETPGDLGSRSDQNSPLAIESPPAAPYRTPAQSQGGSDVHSGAIFAPRSHDVGGLMVGRVLPYVERRMVGPFVFLDHIGPASMPAGQALDVRPHPHIGLSTLTYLFDGEIYHRDNLGNEIEITPGGVNWMTAGRGIAHSERTSADERKVAHRLHGLQFWVALPKSDEETAPGFFHHEADSISNSAGRRKTRGRRRSLRGKLSGQSLQPALLCRRAPESRRRPGAAQHLPRPVRLRDRRCCRSGWRARRSADDGRL